MTGLPTPAGIRPRISAVIPTRNRLDSLRRLLTSLENQTIIPDEVIIVDSSDEPLGPDVLKNAAPRLAIRTVRESVADVCVQRNRGVSEATGDCILLCDDDMEAGPDYIARLSDFFQNQVSPAAVSGMIFEPGISESEDHPMPPLSAHGLLWRVLFLQSVWADMERIHFPRWLRWTRGFLLRHVQKKGNTFTAAGWPIVVNLSSPSFDTVFYGLGASLVKREFLLKHPFPTFLRAHGVGDHYSLCAELFASGKRITVIRNISIIHHKTQADRLPPSRAYYWRVMALDVFLEKLPGRPSVRRILLLWSLLGNIISFGAMADLAKLRSALAAFFAVLLRTNPYSSTLRLIGLSSNEEAGLNIRPEHSKMRS